MKEGTYSARFMRRPPGTRCGGAQGKAKRLYEPLGRGQASPITNSERITSALSSEPIASIGRQCAGNEKGVTGITRGGASLLRSSGVGLASHFARLALQAAAYSGTERHPARNLSTLSPTLTEDAAPSSEIASGVAAGLLGRGDETISSDECSDPRGRR